MVPKVTWYKCCTELFYKDLVEINKFLDIFLTHFCFYVLSHSTNFNAVCQMYIFKKAKYSMLLSSGNISQYEKVFKSF